MNTDERHNIIYRSIGLEKYTLDSLEREITSLERKIEGCRKDIASISKANAEHRVSICYGETRHVTVDAAMRKHYLTHLDKNFSHSYKTGVGQRAYTIGSVAKIVDVRIIEDALCVVVQDWQTSHNIEFPIGIIDNALKSKEDTS